MNSNPYNMAAIHTVQPGWFSIRGAALYTGFSVTAIRMAMSKGRFPFYQVEVSGGPTKETRISREALDAWIQAPYQNPTREHHPMQLSPEDKEKVLKLIADGVVSELKKTTDFAELVTLPLDAIAPIIGVGPKQIARILPTRQMGTRKLGVSLRAVLDYQKSRDTQQTKSSK